MNARVFKRRETGLWSVRFDFGRTGNRRVTKQRDGFRTRREAQEHATRTLHEMRTGSYVEASRLTVGEFLDRWLSSHVEQRRSPKTHDTYRGFVNAYLKPQLGHYALQDLCPLHVEEYLAWAARNGRRQRAGGLGPQTVLHHYRCLHAALEKALAWKLIPFNPAAGVEPPAVEEQDERPALSIDELVRLIHAARGHQLYVPILITTTAGLRRGEILGLRWEDVDLDSGVVTVRRALKQIGRQVMFGPPKSKKRRKNPLRITLPQVTVDKLREHHERQSREREEKREFYDHHGLVVQRPDGTPWPPNAMSRTFADWFRRNAEGLGGMPRVTFHDLRHAITTAEIAEGIPLTLVSKRRGHSTVQLTADRYSHLLPAPDREAAAVMDRALREALVRRAREALEGDDGE